MEIEGRNEGLATNRPPLFTGNNYGFWKVKMMFFLKSLGDGIWEVIANDYASPTTSTSEWTETQKRSDKLNTRAMNALFGALSEKEFSRIRCLTSASKIWKALETFHEGTSHVRENKVIYAQAQYENFTMKKDETISEMNVRFVSIMNDLDGLGEPVSQVNQVRKILRSLPDKFYSKRNAIQESHQLRDLTVEELCGNLMAYEEERFSKKKEEFTKDIGLVSKSEENLSSDDEELAFLSRRLHNLIKRKTQPHESHSRSFRSHKNPRETERSGKKPSCFNCNKPGHIKPDCPLLKGKMKAHKAEWSDSDYSSEEEDDCLMAHDNYSDEVCYESEIDQDTLERAFVRLSDKYISLKKHAKTLKKNDSNNDMLKLRYEELEDENKKLRSENNSLLSDKNSSYSSSDESLKSDNKKLEKEVKHLRIQNSSLLSDIESLHDQNSKISEMKLDADKLSKEIIELKSENINLKYDMLKSRESVSCENCNKLNLILSENEKKCMLGQLDNKKLESSIETLTNQNKILHDKMYEKSLEIKRLHAKIKDHELTIYKYTNSSKNLNQILNQSQASRNKSGLGFNSDRYHAPQNAKRYNKYFVHESTYTNASPPMMNHQEKPKHRMHARKSKYTQPKYSSQSIHVKKVWKNKNELSRYNMLYVNNPSGPTKIWVPKSVVLFSGNQRVNMGTRQRVLTTYDWKKKASSQHPRLSQKEDSYLRR